MPKNVAECGWTPDGTLTVLTHHGRLQGTFQSDVDIFLDAESTAWSPDGRRLASYTGRQLRLWRPDIWHEVFIRDYPDEIVSLSWSLESKYFAVGFKDGAIQVHDGVDGEEIHWLTTSGPRVYTTWLPERILVAVTRHGDIHMYTVEEIDCFETLQLDDAHEGYAVDAVRRVGDQGFATLGHDRSVRIWDISQFTEGTLVQVVESPTGRIIQDFDVSDDGRFVVIFDLQGWLSLFDVLRGEQLPSPPSTQRRLRGMTHLAGFKPGTLTFAAVDDGASRAVFLDIVPDKDRPQSLSESVRYRNAKVVIVGDTGVGKSGLALALTNQSFVPTESTHARHVWSLGVETVALTEGETENREVLIWDLAGQAGYRSFHKLSLRDVSVGLVVFDARSESDPFKGVPFWARALDDVVTDIQPKKILVSARCDRGSVSASIDRIDKVLERFGFSELIETSAKTGEGVHPLQSAVADAITWTELPVIVAPRAFVETRSFLVDCKAQGRLVDKVEDLYAEFSRQGRSEAVSRSIFELCLNRLEAAGLATRLAVNGEWLLQPELLDRYVAYMAQAARKEPDGLGQILEQDALLGHYSHEELPSVGDERIMLVTAVNEVVGRNLALRVPTDVGQMLVFPSERRTDLRDYPSGYDLAVEYRFVGAVSSIYAGVAVKLINSLSQSATYELYHNSVLFTSESEGEYGFAVDFPEVDDDSSGRLIVFFETDVRRDTRLQFLRYVDFQLRSLATGRVQRDRVYSCCSIRVDPEVVELRRTRGHGTVVCAVCERRWPMDDLESSGSVMALVQRDRDAAEEQAKQQRLAIMPSLKQEASYHVFLCHNAIDGPSVGELAEELGQAGVLAWVDKAQLLGGRVAMREIEAVIKSVPAIAVVIGPNSIGRWQEEEYYASLSQAVISRSEGREVRLIPILLPGAGPLDELPAFLRTRSVVDMRASGVGDSRKMRELVSAVLGQP